MPDAADRESKTQEPTPRRLERARQEGQVVKSPEVAAFAALAAASGLLLASGGAMARGVADALLPFIAHPDAIDLSGEGGVGVLKSAMQAAAPGVVVMLAAAAAAIFGNLVQHGFLFTPARLAPDWSKLNPASGLKRLFGPDSLIQFAKTFVRFCVLVAMVAMILRPRAVVLAQAAAMDPAAIMPLLASLLRVVLVAALALFAISAAADWFLQRRSLLAKLRMSREEVKQEQKDQEGDPQLKAKIKQLRLARAKTRIAQSVPKATLVITNPTHFAVALRYVQGETAAPICVAKGADLLALRIREIATEHRVPIVEDPPLARALFASVDIDETIPREHYQAVAKIVGFVMSAAARRRPPRPLRPTPAGAYPAATAS